MMKLNLTLTTAAALALSACTSVDNNLSDARQDAFSKSFGSATDLNKGALTGDLERQLAAGLTRKFATETQATINFAFDSAVLDATAQAALREQAEWMKARPNITFTVFGHTDKVGSAAYNKSLGLRRAKAAVNYLIRQGVDRTKLRAVASFGEERPLVITEARNPENRRTVTEVQGFYRQDGTYLDGRVAVNLYQAYIGATGEAAAAE